MSHFESPEHCYDFHSVVKCFSPLNCWLVLDSGNKVLTFDTVRMSSGQQERSPQQHRSSLSFCPVGGWKAPEQHNLQLPIPKSWLVQWGIAHCACPKSRCQVGMWLHWQSPALHPSEWEAGISGCCHPCVCSEPSTHCHSRCLFQLHPCSSEMPSNYMWTLNKRAV